MLSVLVPARNQRALTAACLNSLYATLNALELESELILMDDASEEDVLGLYHELSKLHPDTHIHRFEQRVHYTGVFNYGLQQARGELIFFLSNDMLCTPSYLSTLLAVAALSPSFGTVRGRSNYVDNLPEHKLEAPVKTMEDAWLFSRQVADQHGLDYAVDPLFSGDAALIKREVLDRIGTFDPRFFGYFSDLDFGLRAQKAGFQLVCARGAWLYHEGGGHTRTPGESERRLQLIQEDYARYRAKWDPTMPELYLEWLQACAS